MIKRIYLNDKQNPANIIYPITDEQSVRDGNGVTLATKLSDLPQVKEGAALGRTAYQKPVTGIPASDIAEGVIPDVTNFVTRSVNDLVNYYTKSQTYTKEEVANLIAAIQQFHYEVVVSTSAVTSPSNNVLYLVGPTGSGSDKYEEYVYDSTKDNPWIKIGDTSIDLSGYVTTQSLNAALSNYVTSSDLVSALSSKQDTLVSGTNIKTINGNSILGSGNITIGEVYTIPITLTENGWVVDSSVTYATVSEAISDGKILAIVPNGEGRVLADYEVQNGTINVFGSFCQMDVIGQLFVSLTDGETPEADFTSVAVPDSLSDLTDDSAHRTVTDAEKDAWNEKYTKPVAGIPESDLAAAVAEKLNREEVFVAEYSPSGTKSTYQEIVNAYNAGKVVVLFYNDKLYRLNDIGTLSSVWFLSSVATQDNRIRCSSSNQWIVDAVYPENSSNKTSDIESNKTSTSKYPSTKGVADYVASKELSDLADVSDTAPTDGQALLWDGTNEEWKPGTVLEVVNNDTDGGETAAWSAERGKILRSDANQLEAQVDALMDAFEDPDSGEETVTDFADWPSSRDGTTNVNTVNVFKPVMAEDTQITKLKIRFQQKSAGTISLKLASVKVESNNVVDTTAVSEEIVVTPGLEIDAIADVDVVLAAPFTVKAGERLGIAMSAGNWLRLSSKLEEYGTLCAVMAYYTGVTFATFTAGSRISSNISYVNFENYKVLVLPYTGGDILIKDIPTRGEMNTAIQTALIPVGETTTALANGISSVNGRVDGINRSLKDSAVVSKYWTEKCAHCASIADGGDGYFYVAYYASDTAIVEGYRNDFLCRLAKVSQYKPTDVTIIDVLKGDDVVGGFVVDNDRHPYDPNILVIGDTIRYFVAIAQSGGYMGLAYRDISKTDLSLGNAVTYCKIKYTINGTTYTEDATHENLDKMINRYYGQESGGTIGAYPIFTTPFVTVEDVIYGYLAGLGAEGTVDAKDWSGALVKSEDNGATWEVVAWANDLFDARADYPMWEAGIAYLDGKMYILFKFADTPIAYYDLVNEQWSQLVYLFGYYGQGPTIDNSKPCLYALNGKLYAFQNVQPRLVTSYGEIFRGKVGCYRLTPVTMAKEEYFEFANDAGCQYFSIINQQGRLYLCFTEDKAHRHYQMKGDISIIPIDFLPMPE